MVRVIWEWTDDNDDEWIPANLYEVLARVGTKTYTVLSVSTACKLPMKFEIKKLVQILNFMGSSHAVLSVLSVINEKYKTYE